MVGEVFSDENLFSAKAGLLSMRIGQKGESEFNRGYSKEVAIQEQLCARVEQCSDSGPEIFVFQTQFLISLWSGYAKGWGLINLDEIADVQSVM